MIRQTDHCFELFSRIEELAEGNLVADWSRVNALVAQLIETIRKLVELLRIMHPVEFMDVHEWSTKLGFYARLAVDHNPTPAGPPYLTPFSLSDPPEALRWATNHLHAPDGKDAALAIMPSLYAYYVEANDLRPDLDSLLRDLSLADPVARTLFEQARTLLLAGSLPQALQNALEIAAVELAPHGGLLDLRFFVGQGAEWRLLDEQKNVRPLDITAAWKNALALKFSFPALCERLSLGLTDEEHLFVIVATGSRNVQACFQPPPLPDARALVQRLEPVLPRVTQLRTVHSPELASPKNCRSLHDLVCLCLERGLARIFAFVGEPARSLSGIKLMRLEIPVTINVFNLGDGLFPPAAERSVISTEDVRSIPAWSLLLGLTNHQISWPETESDKSHYSSYAVLSEFFMHCTLRLDANLYMAECNCADNEEKYIKFVFKGGFGQAESRRRRMHIMRLVLEKEGFCTVFRGDYLNAFRIAQDDVSLQRSLVSLGLLIAWIQGMSLETLSTVDAQQEAAGFYQLLHAT